MISAVVLTHNEELTLRATLKSLTWTDEIAVIDDTSSDKTVDIARKLGAKVFSRKLNGDFAAQRNFGLEKAAGEWVVFVDADEIVPRALAQEILQTLKSNPGVDGFVLSRRDWFMGRQLNYGETGMVKLLRLGRKTAGKWRRRVHEIWKINGPLETLKAPLEHHSHENIHQFIKRINDWTDIDAAALNQEGKNFSVFRLGLNPLGKFLSNYFLKLGILDGFPGFVMAFMMSLYSLVVRVKQYGLSQTS